MPLAAQTQKDAIDRLFGSYKSEEEVSTFSGSVPDTMTGQLGGVSQSGDPTDYYQSNETSRTEPQSYSGDYVTQYSSTRLPQASHLEEGVQLKDVLALCVPMFICIRKSLVPASPLPPKYEEVQSMSMPLFPHVTTGLKDRGISDDELKRSVVHAHKLLGHIFFAFGSASKYNDDSPWRDAGWYDKWDAVPEAKNFRECSNILREKLKIFTDSSFYKDKDFRTSRRLANHLGELSTYLAHPRLTDVSLEKPGTQAIGQSVTSDRNCGWPWRVPSGEGGEEEWDDEV